MVEFHPEEEEYPEHLEAEYPEHPEAGHQDHPEADHPDHDVLQELLLPDVIYRHGR